MMNETLRTATAAEKSSIARAMVSAVLDLGTALVDDGHRRYELPAGVEPRAWGSVISGLIAMGIIAEAGRTHTRRRVAHGRSVVRYYSPDIGRARQYLDGLGSADSPTSDRQRPLPGLGDEPEIGGAI